MNRKTAALTAVIAMAVSVAFGQAPPPPPAAIVKSNYVVRLAWDAVPEATAYLLFIGTNSGSYYTNYFVQGTTALLMPPAGPTYYFAVQSGAAVPGWMPLFSVFSNEAVYPPQFTNVVFISAWSATSVNGPWLFWTNIAALTNPAGSRFFKLSIVRTNA